MKKIFAFAIIIISAGLFSGCQQGDNILNEFSEITCVYYNGISQDGNMSASISVGEREDPYIIDGIHGVNCDFSLLIVKFHFPITENEIKIDFLIENEKNSVVLEFNPLNSTYMADLGYALNEGENYSLVYKNNTLDFNEVSAKFKIDYITAIDIAVKEVGENLKYYYNGNQFKGECYLKVLSKPDGDFQDLYWIFTIIGENENRNNVLIDIKDGSVVMSN